MNQSEFLATYTSNQCQARENAYKQGTIGFVLILIGWQSGASFANQSQSLVKQNQSKWQLISTLNYKPIYPLRNCWEKFVFRRYNKVLIFIRSYL